MASQLENLDIQVQQDPSLFLQILFFIDKQCQKYLQACSMAALQGGPTDVSSTPVQFGQAIQLVDDGMFPTSPDIPDALLKLVVTPGHKRKHKQDQDTDQRQCQQLQASFGQPITNDSTNPKLLLKRKANWSTQQQLRKLVRFRPPPKTDDGQVICLKWHCLGRCYDECKRKASHTLTEPQKLGFYKWFDQALKMIE